MPIFESSSIKIVSLHRVGNKPTEEGYLLSDKPVRLSERLQDLLIQYFVSPFKVEEYYHLYHEENVELNPIYRIVSDIFDHAKEDASEFHTLSQSVAEHLYNASTHPNIKSGDLFVVYFNSCMLNGETMDAVGFFKSENKDDFLKILHDEEEWSRQEGDQSAHALFTLEADKGINIRHLDKGALVFNTERDKGYVVSVVDSTNRGMDAAYWKDTFLSIRQRQDEYFNTHEVMTAYKQFITDELPQQFEVTKADQADLLNKSVEFFKQKDNFDLEDFSRDVLGDNPEVVESFTQFKQTYEKENDVVIPEQFDINESAVKKQARAFKSVIKLDKNFHIYVHGDRQLIEQGEDEKGKFYKVYYREES